MAVLLGKNLQILSGASGSSPIVAMAKSCDVHIDGDLIEKASPSSGSWKQYLAGRKGWSITVNYLVTAGGFKANAQMVNTTVTIRVSDGTVTMQGTAFVKTWKVTGTVGNLAQGSFQLVGTGALT